MTVQGPRRPRPCTECGKQTEAKLGVCSHCQPRNAVVRPETRCYHCETRTTAKAGICRDCSRMPLSARPCADDELTGGHWLNVRGVQRYVPNGCGYDWVARTEAAKVRTRDRVQELIREQSDTSWWARPPMTDDPSVIARRVTAALAEIDELEGRTTREEVA